MFGRWRSTVFLLMTSVSAISSLVWGLGAQTADLLLARGEHLTVDGLAGASGSRYSHMRAGTLDGAAAFGDAISTACRRLEPDASLVARITGVPREDARRARAAGLLGGLRWLGYVVGTPWLMPAATNMLLAMVDDSHEFTTQAGRVSPHNRRATARWLNDGGHVAPDAVLERERTAQDARRAPTAWDHRTTAPDETGSAKPRGNPDPPSLSRRARPRVVIAGGGVAGLETLLALRSLARDRVDITLVEPELKFVNRSMAVMHPFRGRRVRGVRMEDIAAEFGARLIRRTLDRVSREQRVAVTKDGMELPYEMLVLAIGARRPERPWPPDGQLMFYDGRDGPDYALLLQHVLNGRANTLAFVRPVGPSWPLPLYDLALLTAADCASHGRSAQVEFNLITPEQEPLGIFGPRASAVVRGLLDEAGVTLHTSSSGVPARPGWLDVSPGQRQLRADRIVTEPRLVGPRLRGVPCGPDGFIHTDRHGRVPGMDGVFAAGDATAFPIKQGGLAAQQADAVAEVIACSAGADIRPQPIRPILRGTLLTGAAARYLRADISGTAGDDSMISTEALWWPPNKLCGRYLAPYLSGHVDDGIDVMPQDDGAIAVEVRLDSTAQGTRYALDELADIG
jgi:sulfide:quinone oxidoreductase